MSTTREILTLQFGHYSNYVGTHFWNIQEQSFNYTNSENEINHDVLYREGETSKGQTTYTPRLLLTDLKGSLKHLPKHGALYENPDEANDILAWTGEVQVQKEPEIEKNFYQKSLDDPTTSTESNIENEVETWPDFLYGRFHPRTINIINEYQHQNTKTPFQTFSAGTSLWQTEAFLDDYSDKIRLYAEESDNIQGFQIFFDATDGFSGLAASCIDYIRDDFENKSILAVPIIPSYFDDLEFKNPEEREQSTQNSLIRQINFALGISSIYELSSLVVPLSTDAKGWQHHGVTPREFQYLNYNYKSYYHSSAIIASTLDNLSLRYRQKYKPSYLFHLCNDLNGSGRKIAAGSIGLPFGMKEKEYLIESLDNWEGPLWTMMTPNCNLSLDKCMQSITVRGLPEDLLKKPSHIDSNHREMPAYRCNDVQEMISFYLSCTCYATASHVTTIQKGMNIKVPYPKIFKENINQNGFVSKESRVDEVASVPVISGVHSSAGIGDMLESLYRETKRLKFARFKEFHTAGLELDDYNEKINQVMELREAYIEEHFL